MTDIRYPKGIGKPGNTMQIAVRFPDAMFKTIIARAKREKKTFNETVVDLCKCGELCLSESDKHEAA